MAGVVAGRPADSWRAEAGRWKTLFSRFPGSSGFDVNEVLPVRGAALRRGCGGHSPCGRENVRLLRWTVPWAVWLWSCQGRQGLRLQQAAP